MDFAQAKNSLTTRRPTRARILVERRKDSNVREAQFNTERKESAAKEDKKFTLTPEAGVSKLRP
jgi:hypothetical protein